ncbi:hypothetical protein BCR36DRAFT_408441 [Piromyces finnis]|uniref:C-type lectin domain-containing protein n=1 Tax=Piromyces finnis TaxID=1754191 RepID=A0A1Y1VN87_9FUNG|nr:hypothetical protein BCR36DRAFT_408441 [Piromyces finnis]|eukprot:ORX60081.1 hypothetical protein BCR36DRAFT_408441 [Piromyces finnis]
MNDTIQDNIEYIFDYQTKLSYNLPINTIQLFEIDLSNSILNSNSTIQAINKVQEVLSKGFRKLYVDISWDKEENNWKICNKDKNNTNCIINYNEGFSILNLVKSIRKWIDNSNDCHVIILILRINSFENDDKVKTISDINDYMVKLDVLKGDIMSEIKDILYTVEIMKYESNQEEKNYDKRSDDNTLYINKDWISFNSLCSMNKKLLIGLESNNELLQYEDNILFTDYQLIKKPIQYKDLKKHILFLTPKISRNNKINKIIKLVEKRKIDNETSFDHQNSNNDYNNNLSVIFNHDDIINVKKEVIDFIKDNNISIQLKTYDLNSIQLLKSSLIWSWDINTDFMKDSIDLCIVINSSTGNWQYHSCDDKFPIACRNINNSLMWSIKENNETCDNGYILSLPYSSEENNVLLKTFHYNKTMSSSNFLYLTKTSLEINDEIEPDRCESKVINMPNVEKHLIVQTNLEYGELLNELVKTSLKPALAILIIVLFLVIKSIRKQYVTFKRRRRRMDIKKRLKIIETQTVPI